MADGIRRTRKCLAYIGTDAYRLDSAPSDYMATQSEVVAGAGYVGAFQTGNDDPGLQYFMVPGMTTQIRARDAAVGAASTDELWSRIMNAGGCRRLTAGTNALPHSYTLDDVHATGDTPAPETISNSTAQTPFATFGIQTDGTAGGSDWLTQEGDNCVTDWGLSLIAGQRPMMPFSVWGNLGDGTTTATNLTLASQKAYKTEGTTIAWYNAALTVTANGLTAHTPVLRSYEMAVNNVIPVRADANGALGCAPMQIVDRNPTGTLVFEAAHGSSIATKDNPDHWWRNKLYFDLSGTIELGAVDTAGGAITANTITITQRAYCAGQPRLEDNNGILTWTVPWKIDAAATAANAWRLSLAA